MYKNIGKKIKGLAIAIAAIETLLFVFLGVAMIIETEEFIWLAVVLGAPIVAWIFSWLLYGFGEIIDKLTTIEEHTRKEQIQSEEYENYEQEKIEAEQGDWDGNYSAEGENAEDENNDRPDYAEPKQYMCPTCNSTVYEGDNFCTICGQKFNWNNN